MGPDAIIGYIFAALYLICVIVFIDKHNRTFAKIAAVNRKKKRKKISKEKSFDIKKKYYAQIKKTKNNSYITFTVITLIQLLVNLLVWFSGGLIHFVSLVTVPIFTFILIVGFWLKGAGTVNRNMRLPNSQVN